MTNQPHEELREALVAARENIVLGLMCQMGGASEDRRAQAEAMPIVQRIDKALSRAPQPQAGEVVLDRFPPETTDVQSRYIIVHQLRASADIQDGEITRTMGRKATTDRASLMRKAADTIEALAHPQGKSESTDKGGGK